MVLAFWSWYEGVLGVSWAVLEASRAIFDSFGSFLDVILAFCPSWDSLMALLGAFLEP